MADDSQTVWSPVAEFFGGGVHALEDFLERIGTKRGDGGDEQQESGHGRVKAI